MIKDGDSVEIHDRIETVSYRNNCDPIVEWPPVLQEMHYPTDRYLMQVVGTELPLCAHMHSCIFDHPLQIPQDSNDLHLRERNCVLKCLVVLQMIVEPEFGKVPI